MTVNFPYLERTFPVHSYVLKNIQPKLNDPPVEIAIKITMIAVLVFQKLYLLIFLAEFVVLAARVSLNPVKPFMGLLLFSAFPKDKAI